jgi:squalene-hopene/tetraprenyl-beta-curcumene cyclase
MVFISKLQGSKANTALGDKITPDGGFIYATSTDKDHIDQAQSQVGEVIDTNGQSRLRTYGSMTYAGFMSYLYAQLDRNDPRVKDAYNWIRENYTLEENPYAGKQGYFYYLHMLSRALKAWGEPTITDGKGVKHDWANELVDKIASMQKPDGSFTNEKDRWMEGNPELVTAYALLAIQHAIR